MQEFQAAEGMTGRLILRPTDKFQSGSGATHLAELARLSVSDIGFIGTPILNPKIEQVDHRGFVLSGFEVRVIDGVVHHFEQVWLVRPHHA